MLYNRKIAKRYAKAFLNDNIDIRQIDSLIDEFQSFVDAMVSNETIREFFICPIYSREQKIKIMKDLSEKIGFSPGTVSLFEILIKNDRMDIVPSINEELRDVSDRIHNRIRVTLTTAFEPSVSDIELLSKRINDFFGRNAIVERRIDKSILGGFILEGEGKLIDMSIQGQLRRALS